MSDSSGGKSEDQRNDLVKSIRNITEAEENILSEARDLMKETLNEFVEKKIGLLFKIVSVYKDVLLRYEMKTKADFERYIQRYYRYKDVQEAADEWHDVEREWDDLLADIDKKLDTGTGSLLEEGDEGPVDVSLDELSRAGGQVLLISFGVRKGAEKWLLDNRCTFDMLLDSERKVYKAFSLKRSVLKVWSISCLMYYVEQMVAGRELPAPYEDIEDDPHQMGGDFILDKDGKARLIYRSKASKDRPAVDVLLKSLKELN